VRQAAHNLRAEYLEICGVIAEDTSTLLSLAPCSRGMHARGDVAQDPRGRAIARVSLSMSQSGLFSACFPAGKGVGRAAERSRYFEELGRDKVGLASGWTDVPTAAF
jgi:hypothetical protein